MAKSMKMPQENPATDRRGRPVGQTRKSIVRRKQLRDNPGVWFLWDAKSKYSSTAHIWSNLLGVHTQSLTKSKGFQVGKQPYQVASRLQDDGTYKKYVRYIGENREYL